LISVTTVLAEDKPGGTTRIHCLACTRRDVEAQININPEI
jgi:hypothetical protein